MRVTKNKEIAFALLVPLAFTLICAFPLFKMEYSTDTYHVALLPGLSGAYGAMEYNGRLFPYLVIKLFEALGLSFTGFYYVSFIMAIIFSSLSVTLLYSHLRKYMSLRYAMLLSVVTVFNPFMFEYFLFLEKGFFMLGVFLAILASILFDLFLKGKRAYIWATLPLVTVCAFTYQPLCAIFAALSLVFILINSKSFKEIFINTSLAVLVYGFGTFANFIAMKTLGLTLRMESTLNFGNIYKFLTFGIYKAPLLLVYPAVFLILSACVLLSHKRQTGKAFSKDSVLSVARYSFLIIGTLCAVFAPCVFSLAEHVWFTPRFAYAVGTLVGLIPILCIARGKGHTEKVAKRSFWILTAVILILIMVLHHAFFFSRHITNAKDWQDAQKIGEIISAYEQETGIEIKKISIYFDSNVSDGFFGTVYLPNCNVRALTRKWCDVAHLSLILGKNYEKVENNSSYSEYFSAKDFNNITKENAIFEGNTLHLCVY